MSVIKVEQEDLQKGYTLIESAHAILGTGTTKVVAIKGGSHPKMRLLVKELVTEMGDGDGLSAEYSFAVVLVDTTGGIILDVLHKDGLIAGRTAAQTTISAVHPFAPVASSDESIFEANEDVILQPSTANGSAADSIFVVLKFEEVK